MLWELEPNPGLPMFGFAFGAMLGVSFGWMIHHCVVGLFLAFVNCRTERILLRHLDALVTSTAEDSQD
jgi:hypothetical protein